MENTYHKENLKEELIKKTIEIISKEGIDKVSMRYLANKCEVSRQAPYNYFENKECMLKECASYVSNEFSFYLEKSIEGFDNSNPKVLTLMGRAYIEFFKKNPSYFDFIYNNNFYEIKLTMKEVDNNFKPFEVFRRVCVNLTKSANISEEVGFRSLVRCWSLVHGAASIVASNNVILDGEWDDALSDLFNFGA